MRLQSCPVSQSRKVSCLFLLWWKRKVEMNKIRVRWSRNWSLGEKVNIVLISPSDSHQMFVFVFVFAWQRKDGSHLLTDTYKVLLRAVDVFWGESLRFSDRLGPPHRFYINLRNSFCFAQISELWSPDSTSLMTKNLNFHFQLGPLIENAVGILSLSTVI